MAIAMVLPNSHINVSQLVWKVTFVAERVGQLSALIP